MMLRSASGLVTGPSSAAAAATTAASNMFNKLLNATTTRDRK